MSTRIKVNIKRRTKILSHIPKINGLYTSGDIYGISRTKNRNVLSKYPVIERYLRQQLSPDLLQPRRTIYGREIYIIPALNKAGSNGGINNGLGSTVVKYVFGQATKSGPPPSKPWEKINNSDWYVLDAESVCRVVKHAEILIGTSCTHWHFVVKNPILTECDNIRYFQYHVYCYDPSVGRIHMYTS